MAEQPLISEECYSFKPLIEWEQDETPFLAGIRKKEWDSWAAFNLRLEAEALAITQTNEELLCPVHLHDLWARAGMIPYPHQLETVRRVIREMRGRAILADEVGLGKTIEAAMILKEYLLRGLVRRFLILTPATLCRQWAAELMEKFQIPTIIARRGHEWDIYNGLICSIDTAKRQGHREKILARGFDLVIVDEAHKLKNARTVSAQFVQEIPKKYFLLLTATPLQNDLKELFTLISLLRPGQLGNYRAFRQRYVAGKRKPKNHSELREILSQVMVRNKRGPQIQLPERQVTTIPLTLTPPEQELYEEVTAFIRKEYRPGEQGRINPLTLITLQREVCSSSFAVAMTLYRLAKNCDESTQWRIVSLLEKFRQIKENAKIEKVLEILSQSKEKFLIFTEFIATQEYIRSRLHAAGIPTLCFDGTLSASKKDWTRCFFRDSPHHQVMVCTETGGEGVNLQFCHQMINYDLPWNPMRIEQRIGRIHRLGQTRPVKIYNLSTVGTIEEHLLNMLEEKIRMFELVIGDMNQINRYLGDSRSFEGRVMEAIVRAKHNRELRENLAKLGEEIANSLAAPANSAPWDDLI
ncbi:MAG TPA: SNF2-related protein [Bacillota bacterium]|nr:SNF2-related protein [Bacillota bacterium]